MSVNVFVYSLLAGLAPLFSASLPFVLFKNGINTKYYHMLLAVSAGLLFAVATLELLPEAVEMANMQIINTSQSLLDDNNNIISTTTISTTTRNLNNEEHDHDHTNESHEEGKESNARIPMYGLAFGFIILIAIELLLSGNGGGHSHSLNHDSSEKGIEIEILSDTKKKDDDSDHHHHEHNSLINSPGSENSNNNNNNSQSKLSLTAFIALSVHSLVDGMVISGAFAASSDIGARVALAIVVHKLPDGFVMSSIALSQKKLLGYHPFFYLLLIASMTPLGSLLASIIFGGIPPSTVSFILGFGAGTFLYITTTGILPEILHSKSVSKPTIILSIILGYFIFTLIDSSVHVH